MTLDSTYLRARLARVIQEHFRLHRLDRLSLSIGLVEIIILHELASECGKHDRLQYFLAFCPDQANALGIMQLKFGYLEASTAVANASLMIGKIAFDGAR